MLRKLKFKPLVVLFLMYFFVGFTFTCVDVGVNLLSQALAASFDVERTRQIDCLTCT